MNIIGLCVKIGVKGGSNHTKDVFQGKKKKKSYKIAIILFKKTRKSPYVDYKFQHVANTW
jgi:hypothetical protein